MATKEQERKALQKIKKIIEEVGGADSYIGMAFEGIFDIAEDNIDNDWGNSARFYIDKYTESHNQIKAWEGQKAIYEATIADKEELINIKNEKIKELKENSKKMWNQYCEETYRTGDLEEQLKAKDGEIIRLKAKLYDLMTA